MKFIDRAKIFVQSGDGGNGCVSFRREKFIPQGGPDGGDGGNGGSIKFKVVQTKETLIDFANRVHFKAGKGQNGSGARCYGKNADDILLEIPIGTQVWNEHREIMFFDAIEYGQEFVIAQGGKGGAGNAKYATSTNRAPKYAKKGEPGSNMWLWLILKLFADIGYVGLPNAGKSSLLKLLTGSQTKVANYAFTTKSPSLGTLWRGDMKLLMADLPGIIEQAHENKGLGLEFLGHIERCCAIMHIIDCSNLNVQDSLEAILFEIEQFSKALLEKKQIIVLNKIDLISDKQLQEQIETLSRYSMHIYPISCATKQGVAELIDGLFLLKNS